MAVIFKMLSSALSLRLAGLAVAASTLIGTGAEMAQARPAVAEAGGSVYLALDLHPESLISASDYKDDVLFQTPACSISDRSRRETLDLQAMYLGGQRKIGIVLWHAHLPSGSICKGYLLNSGNNDMVTRVTDNLNRLVNLAKSIGFNEIQIRFGPQWINDPRTWKNWSEPLFRENLAFIQRVTKTFQSKVGIRVIFDLGGELGGIESHPLVERYVKQVWVAMAPELAAGLHTYGFSLAFAAGRLKRYIEWLSEVGPVPTEFALDIYEFPARRIGLAAQEARAKGNASPVFIIQETLYDDKETYESFLSAARSFGVTLRTIMQWPKRRGSTKQISEGTTPIYIYCPTN